MCDVGAIGQSLDREEVEVAQSDLVLRAIRHKKSITVAIGSIQLDDEGLSLVDLEDFRLRLHRVKVNFISVVVQYKCYVCLGGRTNRNVMPGGTSSLLVQASFSDLIGRITQGPIDANILT